MSSHTRKEVLEFINEVIENENGEGTATEDTLVSECGLDSFGITALFLELDEKYGEVEFPDDKAVASVIDSVTIGSLIDIADRTV